ncbi:MAG: hypothetical protein GXP49_13885 [Deltaproteobacteria bacterium]|nr:hypothetical protein [Deltaproteobacteria bacterium]
MHTRMHVHKRSTSPANSIIPSIISSITTAILFIFISGCGSLEYSRPGNVPGGNVTVHLRWMDQDTFGPKLSLVPVYYRLRLVVDYPENHQKEASARMDLVDVDAPPGDSLSTDVEAGLARIFHVASYETGSLLPSYMGTAVSDITGDKDEVTISMEPFPNGVATKPIVSLGGNIKTLAGNLVSLTVKAADLDLSTMSMKWKVERDSELLKDLATLNRGKLEFNPPGPGTYVVELAAQAQGEESEPAFSVVEALDCNQAGQDLECDQGLTCNNEGMCK